ncbi:MAG: ral secretion pathway protein GspE [Ramlibacter sp.]|jgi:general secretion pathway protein E|nr:ral secretion pathway protein GspE [Ramlibacter sp.]
MNATVSLPTPALLRFTPAQVHAAGVTAGEVRRPWVEILQEQSGLPQGEFVRALATTLHYRVAAMEDLRRMAPAFDVLPFAEASDRHCLALREDSGALVLAIGDPFDGELLAWGGQRLPGAFGWCLAHPADLAAYLASHEKSLHAMDALLAGGSDESVRCAAADLSLRTISEDSSPVVKLVHSTVYDALKAAASDIHLESTSAGLSIRYRIDGVLTTMGSFAGLELAEQVISRIKIMSELDISERRVPQDGRFQVSVNGHEVDFRVSIMPSIFGEDAVLRILDKQTLSDQIKGLRLEYLGFDDTTLLQVRKLAREAYGMLLVTGPTGSGKTTTLYAAITEINHGQDKIVTIEDPVEYQLAGVLQIPVNEKKGLTFARGLRSILRHDPDKIMVGEIRDAETAQIAVQSALTGHLVFTTVHANSVFDVIGRFIHMGVDPYSFVSAMNGIVAQRLLRVSCPHCAEPETCDPALLAESSISAEQARGMQFRSGRGCGHCRGTGFKGRRAIGEVLLLNDEIREAIVARQPIRVIREAATRNGTRFLRDIAVGMVGRGETTLREINRVTLVA